MVQLFAYFIPCLGGWWSLTSVNYLMCSEHYKWNWTDTDIFKVWYHSVLPTFRTAGVCH